MSGNLIEVGAKVSFQYRVWLPASPLVRGTGVVVAESIVGTSDAYTIKPDDGSACVDVRCVNVQRVEG